MTRKITPLVIAITTLFFSANGQDLKNPSFEDWSYSFGANSDTADYWGAKHSYSIIQGFNKSDDAQKGSYSMELSNSEFGRYDSIWQAIPHATFDEDALTGYYKSDILAGDSAVLRVNYKKGASNILSTSEVYVSSSVSSWTFFQILLDKRANADSIVVYFEASVNGHGSKIWIDNLSWDNFVSVGSPEDFSLTAFPNPAKNQVTLNFNHILKDANIQLISLAGKTMMNNNYSKLDASQVQLDLSNLSPGIYMIQVTEQGVKYNQKLVIH